MAIDKYLQEGEWRDLKVPKPAEAPAAKEGTPRFPLFCRRERGGGKAPSLT
jgi:hypothetical protein